MAANARPLVAQRMHVTSSTRVQIVTWNINHLSDNSWEAKANCIGTILAGTQADIMVLQEVNMVSDHLRQQLGGWLNNNGYAIDWGPHMFRGNTVNTAAQGTQHEYYPIIFRSTFAVEGTYLISEDNATKQTFSASERVNPAKSVPWVSNRPVLFRRLSFPNNHGGRTPLWLGTMHTSPSFAVEKESAEAVVNAMLNFTGPLVIAGDWYVGPTMNVLSPFTRKKTSWAQFLKDNNFVYSAPTSNTNLPSTGSGMVADYFLCHDCTAVYPHAGIVRLGLALNPLTLHGWQGTSDHAPVSSSFDVPDGAPFSNPTEVTMKSEFQH